jgi:hypothetical protein
MTHFNPPFHGRMETLQRRADLHADGRLGGLEAEPRSVRYEDLEFRSWGCELPRCDHRATIERLNHDLFRDLGLSGDEVRGLIGVLTKMRRPQNGLHLALDRAYCV